MAVPSAGPGLSMLSDMSDEVVRRCNADGEFGLAARYWNGSLDVTVGDETLEFVIADGIIRPRPYSGPDVDDRRIALVGPVEVWEKVLAPVPPPMFNDIIPAAAFGLLRVGDDETFWQYYPAVRRFIDLLREEANRDTAL